MIKKISDEYFLELVALWCEMYRVIPTPYSAPEATYGLVQAMNEFKDFLAIGVFEENKLIGFITGYAHRTGAFYWSGIYCPKSKYVKEMMDTAEKLMKDMGYKSWISDTEIPAVASLLMKYGGKPVQYKKEL